MSDDISCTIAAKSDQLNACDLLGGPITVKVIKVSISKGNDQPVSIYIDGDRQPFKPCLTVRRILAKLWGTDSSAWVGGGMTLYCDESVMWAGAKTGGIRVSHITGISEKQTVVTRASKHKTVSYNIEPLVISLPAYTDKSIEENQAAWLASFNEKNTPAKLITKIKAQYTLSEKQEQTILNMQANADE